MVGTASDRGTTIGSEVALWVMANMLGLMDAGEYRHVVLGLLFVKGISDAFEDRRATVLAEWGEEAPEDRDEYVADIFLRPAESPLGAPEGWGLAVGLDHDWMPEQSRQTVHSIPSTQSTFLTVSVLTHGILSREYLTLDTANVGN